MKTAIPVQNGKLADQFGAALEYTLVTGSGYNLELETFSREVLLADGSLVNGLYERGVQRILAAGIEDEFIRACEQAGFQVFHGAGGTLSDGLNLIRLGILDNMAKGGCGGGCSGGGCGGSCGPSGENKEEAGSACCSSDSCGCK